jgi:hypothetical protein
MCTKINLATVLDHALFNVFKSLPIMVNAVFINLFKI